jgi:site-specific recombinase XerD
MKDKVITEIQMKMSLILNREQLKELQQVVAGVLQGVELINRAYDENHELIDNSKLLESFLSAKRIEGCSEKSLKYYKATVAMMFNELKQPIREISTDQLRRYLSNYQSKRGSSKVTIDNMRRIFSSFFGWLEDEDYIIKSPVRRIHKIKTDKPIKETFSDESLELLRDACDEIRDLAMIDLLASTGMRVGELVSLNQEDVNFHERECVVCCAIIKL